MQIEYLENFYKVAKAKSISKVASDTHISQSALSQQVSKLENDFNCILFERSNKGVELTEKGKIVYQYAGNIVRTFYMMQQKLEESDNINKDIRIESFWTIANYSLPCVMFRVKKRFPHNNYEIKSNKAHEIEENIVNNICDLGVIYGKPRDPKLAYYKIGVDRLILIAAADYQIPDKIKLEELFKYPLIILNDNMDLTDMIANKIKAEGKQPDSLNVMFKSDSVESVKASVLNGFGIGFIPYISIKKELYRKQIKLIEITDMVIEYEMYLIYDGNSEDKTLNDFIKYFKDIARKSLC
ncbi:LysR family transcriptional regulator [Acetobacterium woodii]|uniref:Transcriptional regulator LysR family n=1 Tax=Acetobacterium woodii (strain ATCC 29683 / DSM 1030 / JCM 2381 / KCTC 1655 / WB1) TaxID=931626 RepID=H6LC68_ACEWD|nr:LysR family transcriptional regulator [Acetobacterium woodii]AFA49016.1 transcriptional regulator LysR family [Acetobacterium woodii DSM 1030]